MYILLLNNFNVCFTDRDECSFLCKTLFLAVLRTQEKKFRVQFEKKPIVQKKTTEKEGC